jgi:thiol-disulfide isomerase/thioredoxin
MKNLFFLLLVLSSLIVSFAQAQLTDAANASAAPDFTASGEWFNSPPLHISDLRGKVTLVSMWTFGCNNSYNSIPTLSSFYNSYKDQGLEIVGVHTPEFDYEKDAANVANALEKYNITWPVFQDNERATWNAYENNVWPKFYLLDKNGNIRYTHRGEISDRFPNGIRPLEEAIQALLAETLTD